MLGLGRKNPESTREIFRIEGIREIDITNLKSIDEIALKLMKEGVNQTTRCEYKGIEIFYDPESKLSIDDIIGHFNYMLAMKRIEDEKKYKKASMSVGNRLFSCTSRIHNFKKSLASFEDDEAEILISALIEIFGILETAYKTNKNDDIFIDSRISSEIMTEIGEFAGDKLEGYDQNINSSLEIQKIIIGNILYRLKESSLIKPREINELKKLMLKSRENYGGQKADQERIEEIKKEIRGV